MQFTRPGPGSTILLMLPAGLAIGSTPAVAHVKWFAPYDVASQPERLGHVVSPLFLELFLLALLTLWVACAVERTWLGRTVQGALDAVFHDLRLRSDTLIRAGVAAFCIAIWVFGGVILTPELKTSVAATGWLQVAIAICTLWSSTVALAGLGVVVLFVQGVWTYGVFHMMDYPIFLGAAAYLMMTGLGLESVLGVRPLTVVRWGAAVTLMWASVEKWAYPAWSHPLLATHPSITCGFSPGFYMAAAGIVEFSLSFALLWTPLIRRIAAIVLGSMFLGAVFEFGKLDAIGHLLIIVLLVVIAADDTPTRRCSLPLVPAWFSAALAVTVAAYYFGHALLFHTGIV
ncbi:MAG: hypothetical protein WDN25_06130 [Acetobacteraceae bacterium]